MNFKRKGIVVLMVMGIICLLAINADAESAYYTCSIKSVEPSTDGVYLKLTDTADAPAFTAEWFINTTTPKEILAVALTAICLEKDIVVYADMETSILNTVTLNP